MAFWHTKLSVCRVQEKEELRQRIRTQDRKIERLEARQTGLALIVCLSISPNQAESFFEMPWILFAGGHGAARTPWLPGKNTVDGEPIRKFWCQSEVRLVAEQKEELHLLRRQVKVLKEIDEMEEHGGHGKSIFFLPPGASRRSGSHPWRLVCKKGTNFEKKTQTTNWGLRDDQVPLHAIFFSPASVSKELRTV